MLAPRVPPALQSSGTRSDITAITQGRFGVHLASFRTVGSARKGLQKVAARGFETDIVPIDLGSRGTYYRLIAGSASSREQAGEVVAKLRVHGLGEYARVIELAGR